jgi:hypothetical protein
MAECYSNAHAMRRDLGGFKTLLLQGRHFDLPVIGATQFPQDVATRFRNSCGRAFTFALYDAAPRDAVLAKIGKQHMAALQSLAPFEYLEMRAGRVTRGKVRKP